MKRTSEQLKKNTLLHAKISHDMVATWLRLKPYQRRETAKPYINLYQISERSAKFAVFLFMFVICHVHASSIFSSTIGVLGCI